MYLPKNPPPPQVVELQYAANGTGFVTVIEEPDVPGNNTVPVDPVDSVYPENKSAVPHKHVAIKTDDKATGNPIIALIMVLALLGLSIRKRN